MHALLRSIWLVTCLYATMALAASPPASSSDQHLGVASCASSLCHGSVKANTNYHVKLDEFVTWSHQDAHAKAYQALLSERGRSIAAKLALGTAETAPACLQCHADNVPPSQRGARFALSDGVGCEACHGGAEHWIASHAANKGNYRNDVAQGMFPSADLAARAALCASCHVGDADRLATHAMMGAGHPRISFELDTYLALEPPHYSVDANYRRRKPAYNHAQTWAMGQLQASLTQLSMLQGARLRNTGVFPELALFNCSACHDSSTERTEWRRRALTQLTSPGMVPLNDAYWRMSWVIARSLDAAAGARVLTTAQNLQKAVLLSSEQVAEQSRELESELRHLKERVTHEEWTKSQSVNLLSSLLAAGSDGEFRDYLGAEQAVMASELLLIDDEKASLLRPQLDALYRLAKDIDGYRSADFLAAFRALRAAL
jgi:hypothetical protein